MEVSPDVQAMRRGYATWRQEVRLSTPRRDTTVGICQTTRLYQCVQGRWRFIPNPIATIFLAQSRLGAGYVAHELTHAAITWARRRRLSGTAIIGTEGAWRTISRSRSRSLSEGSSHELFCDVQGWLTTQFWRKYYRDIAPKRRR